MNYDAQEAALGLLSLSPTNFSTPPSLIPLKRKQSHQGGNPHPPVLQGPGVAAAPGFRLPETPPFSFIYSRPAVPLESGTVDVDSISCICGSSYDDGFSIACDDCSRWCHAACFDIVEGEVPEEWRCWVCVPRPVDRERAREMQRVRRDQQQRVAVEREREASQRRKTSPGVDRKQPQNRKTSAGDKRKRRSSILSVQQPTTPMSAAPPEMPATDEDMYVDISEPWTHSYVHIDHDIVPSPVTRKKLVAWRGVTALSPFEPLAAIHPIPTPSDNSFPFPTQPTPTPPPQTPTPPTLLRPPSYSIHTTHPVPSNTPIAPYTSTITPSSTYLADPLNAYAHLGMPKPFVHLLGPPLDLALDARITGGVARFVRSGCWPNAVLRPVLCKGEGTSKMKGKERERYDDNRGGNKETGAQQREQDQPMLSFAVFALRDLKQGEEVVLGWEWDDGNAVHALPALIQTPHLFG
jgi:PHD-finger